jgi:hypothetical protein
MSEINPNDLPILDESVTDGDEVYLVLQTEENVVVDFSADQRVGYEQVTTNFTDLSVLGVDNSDVLFDGDEDIEIYLDGTILEVV